MSNSKAVRFGIGIDLGVKTGATVAVATDGLEIVEVHRISSWLKGSRLKDLVQETFKFTEKTIVEPILALKPRKTLTVVGVDWTEKEVFMGNRTNAVRKGGMFGWLSRALTGNGYIVVQLTPSYIRKALGLGARESKTAVHLVFQTTLLPDQFLAEWIAMTEHEKDALIIAYYSALIQVNGSVTQ